jgi:hypothetical protein
MSKPPQTNHPHITNQQWCIPAAYAHASTPPYISFSLHNSKSYETKDRTTILSIQLQVILPTWRDVGIPIMLSMTLIYHGCMTCAHKLHFVSVGCFLLNVLSCRNGQVTALALSRSISRLATSSFQSIRVWLSLYATHSLLILLPFNVGNGQSLISVSNTLILMA